MGQGVQGPPWGRAWGKQGEHGSGPIEVAMGKRWCEALGCWRAVDEPSPWLVPVPTQPKQEPFGPKPHQQRQRGWGEQTPAFPASPARRGTGSPFCLFAMVLIGRKGRGPIKTRPKAADGYLESAAPFPGHLRTHRTRRV